MIQNKNRKLINSSVFKIFKNKHATGSSMNKIEKIVCLKNHKDKKKFFFFSGKDKLHEQVFIQNQRVDKFSVFNHREEACLFYDEIEKLIVLKSIKIHSFFMGKNKLHEYVLIQKRTKIDKFFSIFKIFKNKRGCSMNEMEKSVCLKNYKDKQMFFFFLLKTNYVKRSLFKIRELINS